MAITLIFLSLLACQAVTRGVDGLIPDDWKSTPAPTSAQVATPPSPRSYTVTPSDPAVPATSGTESPGVLPVPEQPFITDLHPDGELFVGDQVSIEVIAPKGTGGENLQAEILVQTAGGKQVETSKFERYGIGGRYQATLYWAWDTTGLEAGEYPITYTIQPQGVSWQQSVTLLPESSLPPLEQGASWASASSDCCTLHYITGTAAQRDVESLSELADTLSEELSMKLGGEFKEPVSIVLLPRVLGHGGFTAQDISLSYLDRNYAGSSPEIVLQHELVHALDGQLGGELRPTLLLEGLAVYLSGGHFKPEPLTPRAAALLQLGGYLPLVDLADNFYPSQHETGYLEAGALVEYMIGTWGWQAFSAFYRDIHPAPEGEEQAGRWSQSEAIDAALKEHFQLSLAELDERFRQALRAEPVTEALLQDVQSSIRQYDAVRRYQQLLDPSAYFMTAWLPNGKTMRQKGIVADYLRHPEELDNLVLEVMLLSTDSALRNGDYPAAVWHLDSIESVLTAIESGVADPLAVDALSSDYRAVVSALLAGGYEPQRVTINENTALALAIPVQGAESGLYLQEVELLRGDAGWLLPQKVNQGVHWNNALNGDVQYRFR